MPESSGGRPAVVLIGAPGSGKTRTGKRLARRLELPFIDTDRRIVALHGPISAIFADHGEPHFRSLEREAVVAAIHENAVVSLGGGAVLDPSTQDDLASLPVVQLTVSAEAVAARIGDGRRPLLAGGIEAWERLVAARQHIYDRVSDLTVDTSRRPMEDVAEEIALWLENR